LLPFATTEQEQVQIFQDRQFTIHDHLLLQILCYVAVLVVILTIFMYRKRIMQIRMGYVVILMGIAIPVVAYFFSQRPDSIVTGIKLGAGGFMPLAGVLLTLVAMRFVRKDEELVKSMDRLR
jgi:hypothetical protein